MRHRLIPLLGLCALAACVPQSGDVAAPSEVAPQVPEAGKIEVREDGKCFAAAAPRTETVVVNDVIEVAPEVRNGAGEVTSPAVFRNITRPAALLLELMTPPQVWRSNGSSEMKV